MYLELLWLLLPLAAASGYYIAKRDFTRKEDSTHCSTFPEEYFQGLNYILNEQPDKAIEVFLKLSKLDANSLDLHLALGRLFRKRGEVDRAILVHQGLINHPGSTAGLYKRALQELSLDYMSAGLLDRAEKLCLELLDFDDKNLSALKLLKELYQQEKEWFRAIDIARRISNCSDERLDHIIAHYYCEMAEESASRNDVSQAMRMLEKALQADQACARAILMKGELFRQTGQHDQAISTYETLEHFAPEFLSEALTLIRMSYQALGKQMQLIALLRRIVKKCHSVDLTLNATAMLKELEGNDVALEFLANEVIERPSLRGIQYLLEFDDSIVKGEKTHLSLVKRSLTRLLENKPVYRCDCCGFTGKEMHWCCPSCKSWSHIKPIQEFQWGASI